MAALLVIVHVVTTDAQKSSDADASGANVLQETTSAPDKQKSAEPPAGPRGRQGRVGPGKMGRRRGVRRRVLVKNGKRVVRVGPNGNRAGPNANGNAKRPENKPNPENKPSPPQESRQVAKEQQTIVKDASVAKEPPIVKDSKMVKETKQVKDTQVTVDSKQNTNQQVVETVKTPAAAAPSSRRENAKVKVAPQKERKADTALQDEFFGLFDGVTTTVGPGPGDQPPEFDPNGPPKRKVMPMVDTLNSKAYDGTRK